MQALLTPKSTDTFQVKMPYSQVVNLLNGQLTQCVVRTPNFFHDGFKLESHSLGTDTIIEVSRYGYNIGDQPTFVRIHVGQKAQSQTVVAVEEADAAWGENLQLTQAIDRWLHGDLHCKDKT